MPGCGQTLAVSRRFVLRGTGAAAGGVASRDGNRTAVAADAPEHIGPGAVPLTLTVNGRSYDLNVEPCSTLADVLRGPLDQAAVAGAVPLHRNAHKLPLCRL
jgi:hypothetical protein